MQFIYLRKPKDEEEVRSALQPEVNNTSNNLQAGASLVRSEKLAILLRPRLSDAVDARGVSLTNRFFYGDEFWFALQVGAASYVIDLVISIHRDCDCSGNLARFWAARGARVVVSRHD